MSASYTPAPIDGTGASSTYFDGVNISGDHRIDALIGDAKWGGGIGMGAVITYSFPKANSVWDDGVEEPGNRLRFFNKTEQALAREALQAWADIADITFVEVAETKQSVGDIRFARSSLVAPNAAYAYYPGAYASAGDVWVDPSFSLTSAYGIDVLLHEIGHALGLKHPFEGEVQLSPVEDNKTNTLMSYTYLDSAARGEPEAYDVLAIQFLYGKKGSDNEPLDIPISTWGGAGADVVKSGAGEDYMAGADGDDRLEAGAGKDDLYGEDGDDLLDGGDGDDYMAGGADEDILFGGAGADSLWGEDGDDFLIGGAGDDYIYGGEGRDIAMFETAFADLDVSVYGSGVRVMGEGDDFIYDVEAYIFGDVAYTQAAIDTLSAAEFYNWWNYVDGGAGNERLNGTDAGDYITGADGDDIVKSADGDDVIYGGAGEEIILSGAGRDMVYGGDDRDVIKSSHGDDVIEGGDGDDVILGGDGDDSIYGGGGDDVIKPGRGDDVVSGGDGDDVVIGFRANEIFLGGAGDDTLIGGLGGDILIGGADDDRLYGGPGRDIFRYYDANFGHDRIVLDFRPGSDAIDFRGSGLELDDVKLRQVGDKVVLKVIGVDSSIVIANDRYGPLAVSDFDDDVLLF